MNVLFPLTPRNIKIYTASCGSVYALDFDIHSAIFAIFIRPHPVAQGCTERTGSPERRFDEYSLCWNVVTGSNYLSVITRFPCRTLVMRRSSEYFNVAF